MGFLICQAESFANIGMWLFSEVVQSFDPRGARINFPPKVIPQST